MNRGTIEMTAIKRLFLISKRPIFLALLTVAISSAAHADTLELKTGQIVQGKFLGASDTTIRFQVDGQEQTFAVHDVLNIGFSDSGDPASQAPPTPAPQTSQGQPAPPPPPATPDSASTSAPSQTSRPPANVDNGQQEPPPPPAAASSQQTYSAGGLTIPLGTSVMVRMIDSVDSSQNKIGDVFHASLEDPLVVGNTVVAPKGADVYGKLSQVQQPGAVSGTPQLTLELTGIRVNGRIVTVDSTDYDVAGKNKGKQSAERIGGGAIAGAVLGGIIGGGRGAAIGATLGAGGGTAVQVLTKGDRVRVPSETLLEFTLQQDAVVPASN
jgi:hypothetical protein